MRIALYSDLHLEMLPDGWRPPVLDVDVVILAGDIGSHTTGIEWGARTFLNSRTPPTVLYVAGNHEYYGADIYQLADQMRATADRVGVRFLENNTIVVGNVRFLGTTLWSNFKLYGSDAWTARSIAAAKDSLSDYRLIRKDGGFISVTDTIAIHEKAAAWLDRELSKPFNGKTVVITHFAPHRGCIAAQYDGDILTPYFVTDMAPLMQRHSIDLWPFGHTHHNVEFQAENGCRVVSNQRGYPKEPCSRGGGEFKESLMLEL